MPRRWWIYGLIGLCFGVADWYYLDLLRLLGENQSLNNYLLEAALPMRLLAVMILVLLNYGIWLVPVIPVAVLEMRRSQSLRRAAIAAAITWAAAMVGYYGYYAILLMFAGLPQMEFMLFSNHRSPDYWNNWWPSFRNLILNQFLVWVLIAAIAGPIVGILSASFYKRINSKKRRHDPSSPRLLQSS